MSSAGRERAPGIAAAAGTAVVVGVLAARVASDLTTSLGAAAPLAAPLVGLGVSATVLAFALGTAAATGSPAGAIARPLAASALPLLLLATLPRRLLLLPPLQPLAATLVQPIQTAAGALAIPHQAAPAWILAGLAAALLGLAGAAALHRAWRLHGTPSVRALVLLAWALLAPLALWRVTVSPAIGDEPHYLVLVESLLHDGDLDVANNYDAATVRRVSPYLRGPVAEHVRGHGDEAVSTHAAGLPVLVLPAWAAAGRCGVAVLLTLVAALLAASLAVAARRLGLDENVARTAWVVGAFLSPIYVFSPLVYPEPVAACLAFGAFTVALRDADPRAPRKALWSAAAAGAALGALGFLHVKFLLLGATVLAVGSVWGGWCSFARRWRVVTTAVLLGLAAIVVHLRVHGAVNPYGGSGPATFSIGTLFGMNPLAGAIDLLLAPQGLLPPYPLLAFAPLGAALLLRQAPRAARQVLVPIVPFFLLYCPYAFWYGGTVPPGRMLLPVVPWVVLAAALGIEQARRSRTGALAVTVAATAAIGLALLGTAVPSLWLFPWLSSALLVVLPSGLAPLVVKPVAVPGLEPAGLAAAALVLAALAVLAWRAAARPLAVGAGRP